MSRKKAATAAAIEGFLMQANPGQFNAVLADIEKLLSGALSDAEVARLARAHVARYGGLARRDASSGGDDKVLLHGWGEAEEAAAESTADKGDHLRYLDPANNRIVTVDPRAGTVVGETDAPPPPSSLPLTIAEEDRRAVAEAVAGYVSEQYATEAATSTVYPCSSTDGGALCKIAVFAEKLNLRSYCSGSWLSMWEVAPGEEGGALRISGSVTIRAHYFEDGNVQMQTSKVAPPQALDTSVPLPSAIVAAIGAFESGLQQELDAAYAELSDEVLKALRRKLGLSKQRLEWNAALHRLSRQVINK